MRSPGFPPSSMEIRAITRPSPPPPTARPPPRPTDRPRTSVTCVGSRRTFGSKVMGLECLQRGSLSYPGLWAQRAGVTAECASQSPCDLAIVGPRRPQRCPDMTLRDMYKVDAVNPTDPIGTSGETKAMFPTELMLEVI